MVLWCHKYLQRERPRKASGRAKLGPGYTRMMEINEKCKAGFFFFQCNSVSEMTMSLSVLFLLKISELFTSHMHVLKPWKGMWVTRSWSFHWVDRVNAGLRTQSTARGELETRPCEVTDTNWTTGLYACSSPDSWRCERRVGASFSLLRMWELVKMIEQKHLICKGTQTKASQQLTTTGQKAESNRDSWKRGF